MRRLLFLIVLLAAPAYAQETYSLSASAGNVATLTDIVTYTNIDVCQRLGLTTTCSQAQACTAANAAGGSSCTAAQARAVSARIWPATQAGREEYVTFVIVTPRFLDLAGGLPALKGAIRILAAASATQVNKDSACASLGLPAGCYP